jgi:hypothetical protein
MRALLKGALKWATQLFGKTILIGDSNTTTVTITGSSLIKLVEMPAGSRAARA